MSRIGKLPISIPAGVTITHKDDIVTVKGPKGELSQYVNPAIKLTLEDGVLTLEETIEHDIQLVVNGDLVSEQRHIISILNPFII